MKQKRWISILLTAACLLSLLPGCKNAENSENDTNQKTENTGVHEAITLMDAQRDYSALIELVHEKYPEIVIEIIPYRGRNMSAYMQQQLETGRMPDIYSSSQAWDEDLQEEHLVDLSQYEVTELYNQARLEEYTYNGELYLLPYDYSISGITYNKTLFDRLGLAVPTSFTQLRDETIPALQAAGVKVCDVLQDLPGTSFQYFFNITSSAFMNTLDGRSWRSGFTDLESSTFASGSEGVAAAAAYFQKWIDCGMMNADLERESSSVLLDDFLKGNTAFYIGSIQQFSQNEDGSGDQYALLPFLSEDGTENTYITQPGRFYGLNKELEEEGNEQKLADALHVLEVLSSTEGYYAVCGENSSNMCSITDFELSNNSPYAEALAVVSKGHSMNMVYTGWQDYLVDFGEAVYSWVRGESDGNAAMALLDEKKKEVQKQGTTYYATVTEELSTVEAAQLSGQMFLEATGADAALISYNVYSPDVPALMGNSYGANGTILKGKLTEEYITIFLPTGWYDTLTTAQLTGSRIKEMAAEGCDSRGTGFHFPYVFLTADGQELADEETYTVVLCGYNKSEKDTLGLVDTGIVGLDAAKDYLKKVGEVSKSTLDASLVRSVSKTEE